MDEQYRLFLSLSRPDCAIIGALSSGPLSVSELAKRAAFPRTTLNYCLKKLKQRGILVTQSHGKRALWAMRNSEELKRLCAGSTAALSGCEITSIAVTPTTEVVVYQGTENIALLWEKMTSLKKFQRLYAIQPDASFNQAVKHLSQEHLLAINDRIKENKIIVEALVHERSAESILHTLVRTGGDPEKFVETFVGRLADTVKLPDDFLDLVAEMYFCDDMFVVISWTHEYGISITDPKIVAFFKELFGALKYLCVKYDQNERMAQKLVNVARSE